MKNKAELIITLFFGLVFIEYMFPFVLVEAAKLESGATIKKLPLDVACVDNNGDGIDDKTGRACSSIATPPGACGLEIISGAPINYGALYPGEISTEQKIAYKSFGPTGTLFSVKGGDWISDAAGNPIISGPEITHFDVGPDRKYSGEKHNLTKTGLDFSGTSPFSKDVLRYFYFQFKVPINGTIGSIHQDITIDLLC